MPSFEQLDAWERSHRLVLEVYAATRRWPREEQYGLISQIRRACVSVASNIAEGSGKRGPREFRRCLDISLGSLAEVEYQLMLARDLGYLTPREYDNLRGTHQEAARPTWKLYCAMRDARK
jgi:four helix bundle protein